MHIATFVELRMKNNLFHFAGREDSQHAVILWLIGHVSRDDDPDLRRLGVLFVETLMNHKQPKGKFKFPDPITELGRGSGDRHVDVLAHFNDKYLLLIEDKTDRDSDVVELVRYREAALSGDGYLGTVQSDDLYRIYFTIETRSLGAERQIEAKTGHKVFTQRDFLDVLRTYSGDSDIVLDYREYLECMEHQSQFFWEWRDDEESTYLPEWRGLYRELEGRLFDARPSTWQGWGWNSRGGFMAFWWQPQGMPDGDDPRLYLQLEWDRLCFKVGAARASRDRRNELKWEWNEKITGQHERVIKPKVMRQGSTMTVAEHQDGWLRYNECGVLDLDASLDVLREAERTLLAAVGISYGRE